jgi:hypothetical protein
MTTITTTTLKLNEKVYRVKEILGVFIVDRFEEYTTSDKQVGKGYVYKFTCDTKKELNEGLKFLSE